MATNLIEGCWQVVSTHNPCSTPMESLLCGNTCINFGFALFAFDAMLFAWVANVLHPAHSLISDCKEHESLIRSNLYRHLKDADNELTEKGDVAEGAVLDSIVLKYMSNEKKRIDACVAPLTAVIEQERGHRIESLVYGCLDVCYFLSASVIADLSVACRIENQLCEFAVFIAAIILFTLHVIYAFRLRRYVKIVQIEVSKCDKDLDAIAASYQPDKETRQNLLETV